MASSTSGTLMKWASASAAYVANKFVEWGLLRKSDNVRYVFESTDSKGGYVSEPTNTDLLAEYEKSPWLYAAVSQYAQSVAAVPYLLKRVVKDGTDEIVKEHDILTLLEQPFKVGEKRGGTWQELVRAVITYLKLSPKAYVEIVQENGDGGEGDEENRGKGKPEWLNVLRPDKTKHVVHPQEGLTGIEYRPNWGSAPIRFLPSEVLLFRYFNPLKYAEGVPPARPAWKASKLDQAADNWNCQFFTNGASPDIVMTADKDSGVTDDQRKQAKTQMLERMRNDRNGRGVYFPPPGVKVDEFGTATHREMQFRDLKKATREEIMAIIGVPPVVLGLTESTNYATASIQEIIYRKYRIIPEARALFAQFQPLLDRFAEIEGNGHVYYLDVDEEEMRHPDEIAAQSAKVVELYSVDLIDRKTALGLLGLPDGETRERNGRDAEAGQPSVADVEPEAEGEMPDARSEGDSSTPAGAEESPAMKAAVGNNGHRPRTPFQLRKARDRASAETERKLMAAVQKRFILQRSAIARRIAG